MLNGNDRETFYALRLLRDIVARGGKPIVVWAGAGVSMWCGFPSWEETASRVEASFRKFEPNYKRAEGARLFQDKRYPELFELLREVNPRRYNRELASTFVSRTPTPVYARFLNILKGLSPYRVVTTNVDEMLERSLPSSIVVQSSDLERCLDLVADNTSFIGKLHGSVSSVASTVFATSDYQRLLENPTYLNTLHSLFTQVSVVFVGYSLRDKYVLELFRANSDARPLFGDGPHFLVTSEDGGDFPESVKVVRYVAEPYADNRSAMTALDIIRVTRGAGTSWFAPHDDSPRTGSLFESGYFLTDVTPPGTWTSSQSMVLSGKDGMEPNAIVGQGFDNSELPQAISPAMQDLMVGLVSFDLVYIPLSYAARVHELLGEVTFWDLVRAGVFRFIYFAQEPVMIFRSINAVDGGDIGVFHASDQGGKPYSVEQQIARQLRPVPGRENEANQLFETLGTNTVKFDYTRFNIPSLTRGALLHPSVQRLLGISDAIFPNSIPRWVTFPVIRLAHTIMAGCACENFSLPATKIGFGSEILVGAAFAVSAARDWADSVASYVLTGQFNSDLGAYVEMTPQIWSTILKFRDTQPGLNLRREILQEFATNAGSEFVASVNAGLRHIVPTPVMDAARDQITALMFRRNGNTRLVPAVWTNIRNSDAIARLWRARSRRELEAHCRKFGIGPKELCPCGSGEKLRDCCAKALSNHR